MTFRIYYNTAADYPLIWSFDEGTQETEQNVRGYRLHGCDVKDGQDLSVPSKSKTAPRVWLEVQANLMKEKDGIAHFYGRWTDSGWPVIGD